MDVSGLTLWLFGGATDLGQAATPQDELRIAAARPASSLALAAGAGVLAVALDGAGATDVLIAVFAWLAVANLLLGAFALIPGAPLDGGRVLHALLWRHHGDRERATRTTLRAGRALGYGFVWLGVLQVLAGLPVGGLWLVLIGWFVLNAARAEQADAVARHVLAGVRVCGCMTS